MEELLAVVKTPRLLSFHPSPLISPQPAQLSNNRLGLQMDTPDQTRPDQARCSAAVFPQIRFCDDDFFVTVLSPQFQKTRAALSTDMAWNDGDKFLYGRVKRNSELGDVGISLSSVPSG